MGWLPRSVLKLIASSCLLLLLLAGLEVFLRKTHVLGARRSWSQPDETIGFRYTPRSEYWYLRENDHPTRGKINRFGWRDVDWSHQKPDGVFRVAVLGDSYVEAFQVESSKTFLKIAEEQLNSMGPERFEFMNFGRSGFTQTEELIVLEDEVLGFSPDMVMVFFLPANDIEDVLPETSLGGLRPFFKLTEDGQLALDTGFNTTMSFGIRKRLKWAMQRSSFADCREIHRTPDSSDCVGEGEGLRSLTVSPSLAGIPEPLYDKPG
jgi:hypothetical protein